MITFAEIRQGVAEMPSGRRREVLKSWLQNDLYFRFERRILVIDYPVAELWGDLMSASRKSRANLNPMDAVLAATAHIHSLTVATRNTEHFARAHVPIFNPWL